MIEPTLLPTLGSRVKYARLNVANLTQKELAMKIGVKQPTISSIEKDEQSTTRYLLQIADALGVSAHWLQTGYGVIDKSDHPVSPTPNREEMNARFVKLQALIDKFELTEEQIDAIERNAIDMAQNFFLDK